jgi:hypothetical protein
MYKLLPRESFEYLRISPRYTLMERVRRDAGRRMTMEFGPSEFFISQWPKVPEQLFRFLLHSSVLYSPPSRSPGFSCLCSSVIPRSWHFTGTSIRRASGTRTCSAFFRFSHGSSVLASGVIQACVIRNSLEAHLCRPSRPFNYLSGFCREQCSKIKYQFTRRGLRFRC